MSEVPLWTRPQTFYLTPPRVHRPDNTPDHFAGFHPSWPLRSLASCSSSLSFSSLELSGTKVYEPHIRALLGAASHLCEAVLIRFDSPRLDDPPFSKHWVEDLEVHAGLVQDRLARAHHVLHCCPVLAQEVEQNAHLPLGLPGPSACLEREMFIDNLLVRIHIIIEMTLVDRPCAIGG